MVDGLRRGDYTLSEVDVRNLINSTVNFRDRVLLKTMYFGGLRRSEAQRLEVQHIDFERKRLTVLMGKGGKTRVVPVLDSEWLADLRHLVGKRDKGLVFVKNDGSGLHNDYVYQLVVKAGVKSGVKNPFPLSGGRINPHLLRHSIARHLKDKGYPVEFVQRFLGHASFKTTMDVYGRMGIEEQQRLVARKTGDLTLLGESERRVPEVAHRG